ncbi:hypothetical protein [Actinoalloteichus caeruleus]|uniref:hypothetical protein n=1 Tax=Actinoalloteichus cyanogriseus TaxID=2893586 RepID=UPI0004AB7967|nr:hypothetical protein [Actinoalloteichus caeruleus]
MTSGGKLDAGPVVAPSQHGGEPAADQVAVWTVTTPVAEYEITLGGTLDGFNSAAYVTTNNEKTMMEAPRFQPDRFLRLENIGGTDVVNPRVVINGRRQWHTAEDLLDSILRPGMSDREKAFALFRFFSRIDVQAHNNDLRVDEVVPDPDAAPGSNTFRERADPIKAVNCYYPSGCILSAANLVIMARRAGLPARLLAAAPLEGPYDQHGGAEIEYDGSYHYFDPEARTFFLRRDNETVASYEDIHRDPALVLRTHAHGFAARDCKGAFILLYREHFPPYQVPVEQWTHRMDLRLRPGEELVYRWRHEGRYRYGRNPRRAPGVPYRLANGLLRYSPPLRDRVYRDGIVQEVNTAMSSPGARFQGLCAVLAGQPASVTWKVESPYPIVGGRVLGRFVLGTEGYCEVDVCVGASWERVWVGEGRGVLDVAADVSPVLDPLTSPAIYSYYVRFTFGTLERPDAVGLQSVRLESDLQMSQTALPALSVGRNEVAVRTDGVGGQRGGMRLRVSHGWNESTESAPPAAPVEASWPPDGAVVALPELTELTWVNAVPDEVADHHVVVSTRPDFLLPVSPNFDRLVFAAESRWKVARSFLRRGVTYYWRVRSRNHWGCWSDWGPTWRFTVAASGRPGDG